MPVVAACKRVARLSQLPTDENELLAAALRGDDEALGRLLETHQRDAYNIAYRLLGSEVDARDAVQEAFLLSVRAIRGDRTPPRDPARFRAWLRRVVTNAALAQLRRRPSFRPVPIEEVAERLSGPQVAEPAHTADRQEVRGDVLRALLTLTDVQRVALTLREYQGCSYEEIAETLGVTRAAAGQLLYRARQAFRVAYEGQTAAARPVGCSERTPLLSLLVDDQLTAEAADDIKAHLAECARCRNELDGLRGMRRLLALGPLLAMPAAWEPAAQAIAGAVGAAKSGGAAGAGGASLASSAAAVPAAYTAPAPGAIAGAGGGSATVAGLLSTKVAVVIAAGGIGLATVAAPFMAGDSVTTSPATPPAASPGPVDSPVPVGASPAASPAVSPGPVDSPVPAGASPPAQQSPAPVLNAAEPSPTVLPTATVIASPAPLR
jgi:RNA polymerase sigma-70 factor (ECF subfamily)